jgi:hypothetical protein
LARSNPSDPHPPALAATAGETHPGPADGSHRPPPGLRRSPAPPRFGVRAGHAKTCAPI